MRVLFFSSMGGVPWGGSEELWERAATRALEAGEQVAVSVFDFGVAVPQIERLRERGALMIVRPRRPALLQRVLGAHPWRRQISAFAPDVICLSQGAAYECMGRRSTRPLLEVLENSSAACVNIIQFNQPKADLPEGTRSRCQRLYRRAAVNAFVAERNIGEAAATLQMEIPRARVLRNPVNLSSSEPLELPEQHAPRLACIGRLHVDAKGQDMLLKALLEFKTQEWQLTLAGTGKDERLLREQAEASGMAERVRFAGQVSDLRGLWRDHHMLVLPSRAEGTPLAMVEAMLLGRPVLVTNVGGCAEWVKDGVNGLLAEPTPESIAQALHRAWKSQPRWAAMGAAARQTALSLHDPDPGSTLLGLLRNCALAR